MRSTCDTVHCLGERALFLFHFGLFFGDFFKCTNRAIWYLLLMVLFSQGIWWTKYLAHPKIWRPKPCLLMFASLVTLDDFHPLLSTQLTANLTLKWNSGSMFYPLSHIYAKTPFCCVETVANNALNCWHIVFDTVSKHGNHFEHSFLVNKSSCKLVTTLSFDIFNSSAISCNFNLRLVKMSL